MAHLVETRNWVWPRTCLLVAAVVAALGSASCLNAPAVVGGAGKVVLALALPGAVTISSVSWTVESSAHQPLASGTTNTSRAGATPSFIVGVPASSGDIVTMSAVTSAGVTCTGTSNPFDVIANQTATVSVTLNCAPIVPDGGLGSVVVTGTVVSGDNCPTLSAWMISPQTAAANGGQVDVSVTAVDADPGDTLTYNWSAGSGSFVSATSTATVYTCGAGGNQTLHVSVSDNHTPVPCSIDIAFPSVSCN